MLPRMKETTPLPDRVTPQGRPHGAFLEDLHGRRQRPGPEHDGQVPCLLETEAAGDGGHAAGNPLADLRRGIDPAVQDDGQEPPDVLRGEAVEGGAPHGVEHQLDVHALQLVAPADVGVGDGVPGHQRARLQQVGDLLAAHPGRSRTLVTVQDLAARRRTRTQRPLHVAALVHQLELQQRGLADERLGPLRILDSGQLDQDVPLSLALDGGFRDPELVDAVADGLQRLVHREVADVVELPACEGRPQLGPAGAGAGAGHLQYGELGGQEVPDALHAGRGSGDHQFPGVVDVESLEGDAALPQLVAESAAHPAHAVLHGFLHLHLQHQVGPALQVEAETDAVLRQEPQARDEARSEVDGPRRQADHQQHQTNDQALTHACFPQPERTEAAGRAPAADRPTCP